jgi:hypothetical protein
MKTWYLAAAGVGVGVVSGILAEINAGRIANIGWVLAFALLIAWAVQVIRGEARILAKVGSVVVMLLAVVFLLIEVSMVVKV